MPGRQPFTVLCQLLGRKPTATRVDLHIHTTCSDGSYTPAEIVNLAGRSGMPALAITDHDTVAGITQARLVAHDHLEVIAGVEISAHDGNRPIHLLGYFFDVADRDLATALARLQALRAERYREMVERLRHLGIAMEPMTSDVPAASSLGRRHLAERLVHAGLVSSAGEAFGRFLRDGGPAAVPFRGLAINEAIRVIQRAGGVAGWAHPPPDATLDDVRRLSELGLQALEVEFPACSPRRGRELRLWASHTGLAVTGGSDCHGPDDPRRQRGAGGVTLKEVQNLAKRAGVDTRSVSV
ncbi:MAG: PHP domain-containing protein [Planctomycetes bacterium]|nr:PHP domain-containing protein [Planctomycetota bacterium]